MPHLKGQTSSFALVFLATAVTMGVHEGLGGGYVLAERIMVNKLTLTHHPTHRQLWQAHS